MNELKKSIVIRPPIPECRLCGHCFEVCEYDGCKRKLRSGNRIYCWGDEYFNRRHYCRKKCFKLDIKERERLTRNSAL